MSRAAQQHPNDRARSGARQDRDPERGPDAQTPGLEGVPDLPVAPQDEAGLTETFQTWPRGWLHIPEDPDFPVPS